VEHAFLIIKRVFGFAKACYRGLKKNGNRLFVVAALANLFMARHPLFRLQGGKVRLVNAKWPEKACKYRAAGEIPLPIVSSSLKMCSPPSSVVTCSDLP